MQDWLNETFGETTATLVYYGIAAVAAIIGLWVLWYWARRLSGGMVGGARRGHQRRLAIVDALAVDNHRRLILLRRDEVEHLVMIGGHNDLVVERGIGPEYQDDPQMSEERAPAVAPQKAPSRPARTTEVSSETTQHSKSSDRGTVDNEMDRLLSELSHEKK